MAKPYSYDLRRKVIDAIELDGMKRCAASEHFRISRNTINLWLRRKAETGDVQAKVRQHTGHSHKIVDWEKFRAFAQKHRDKTQAQMVELWEGDISDRTISRALKKIGVTRKKRLTVTRNETSKNELSSLSS
jgi:transposase